MQVLIDPESRAVYDERGERGINGRESKSRGAAQEVWETWAEFKPFKRKLVFPTPHDSFLHEFQMPSLYLLAFYICLQICKQILMRV